MAKNLILHIEVSDNGIGMDQSKVDKVFRDLNNQDMSIISAFATLGLGLVLIHRFCKLIGASLATISNKGEGTTIAINHPVANNEQIAKIKQSVKYAICLSNNMDHAQDIEMNFQANGWDCRDASIN